ncbi:hypothetical protein L6164_028698 [Bauhinia variegata]|uniref:Uncharacterized protein n=1 Tax=Bauhinia variegata TaxID=167791 RepID=A0ACB9L6S4_BAUVA|nr:hypothetical protein L6164_028698 [Bauhinia variegata]
MSQLGFCKNEANVKENGIGLLDGDWFCPSYQFGICGNSKIEFNVNIKIYAGLHELVGKPVSVSKKNNIKWTLMSNRFQIPRNLILSMLVYGTKMEHSFQQTDLMSLEHTSCLVLAI